MPVFFLFKLSLPVFVAFRLPARHLTLCPEFRRRLMIMPYAARYGGNGVSSPALGSAEQDAKPRRHWREAPPICSPASSYSSLLTSPYPNSEHRCTTFGAIASFSAASTMLDGASPSALTRPDSAMGNNSVATCSSPSAHSWPMRTTRFPFRIRPEDITILYDSLYFSRPLGVSTKSLLHLLVG
eukprot:6211153-Pleurochrysis_carterae.AAC.1